MIVENLIIEPCRHGCWLYITMAYQIFWSTPKLWPKIEIQDGGRLPSWIFQNLISVQWDYLGRWFSIWLPNLVQKCWSTSNLWPKIEIQDVGRPPSWNSYITIYDHPRSLFDELHQPVKFCTNQIGLHSFEDMGVWIFAELAWNAYLRPQNFGFWGLDP